MTHSIFKIKIVYFLNWLLSDKRIVNVCFIMKDYGLLSHLPTAPVIRYRFPGYLRAAKKRKKFEKVGVSKIRKIFKI